MWDWIDTLMRGGLQSIGGMIVGALMTCLIQEYRIRKMRRQLAKMRAERGHSEAVLIVSCAHDIRPAVEQHLQKQEQTKLPIYSVQHGTSLSTNEKDWDAFIQSIKATVKKLRQECSPSRILLFTNVPVALGVFLGAILDNGPEVVVHHYFNGVYLPVGYLAHETVKLA